MARTTPQTDATVTEGGGRQRVIDGRYRLLDEIGSGGVGVVYRARHLQLDRDVALKVLLSEYANSDSLRRRFQREARALAALAHPHIVAITDFGVAKDTPFLVMELLSGTTLKDYLDAHRPLPLQTALLIADQILEALAYAHAQDVIHRDLKPRNVFMQDVPGRDVHVRVLDFGLAKFVGAGRATVGPALTHTGMVFGTPAYMAPEQAVGGATDARTDVYALGIILYEMLVGERPFPGDGMEVLQHHMMTPLPKLSERCPELREAVELEHLLTKATAKKAADRYPDAGHMLAELRAVAGIACGSPPPPSGRLALSTPHGPSSSTRGPRHAMPARTAARWPSILVAGTASLVLIGSAAAFFAARAADEPTTAVARPTKKTAASDDVPVLLPSEPSAGAAARMPAVAVASDPWNAPVPAALQPAVDRLAADRDITSRMEKRLHAYARSPGDARALLLLARAYIQRGWRTDGIERYEQAYERDPTMKGDPRMLADLLALVSDRAVSERARRALTDIYGRGALLEVERVLEQPTLDPASHSAYVALRDSLQRLPQTTP